MRMLNKLCWAFCVWTIVSGSVHDRSAVEAENLSSSPRMPILIQQFTADSGALAESYRVEISPERFNRFEKFYSDTLAELTAIVFDKLSHEDQIDYLLLRNHVTAQQHRLAIRKAQIDAMLPLLPFAKTVEDLMGTMRQRQRPDRKSVV